MNRRRFVVSLGLGGLALWTGACRTEAPPLDLPPPEPGPPPEPTPAVPHFRVVEARGTPVEVGAQVGAATAAAIVQGIEDRREWFETLKTFALADREARLERHVQAMRAVFPEVLAEIEGMARGAGLPRDDLLVLNLQTELGAMLGASTSPTQPVTCDDCSTLHLVHGGKVLLAHNEDGDDAYRHTMSILRLAVEGQPEITALAYPGVIPGNVPGINDSGVVQTTNFIGGAEVCEGLPRYCLGRASLACRTLDQARDLLLESEAAYTFHCNLGSIPEGRLVAVDVAPRGRGTAVETDGLFVHTNHFVLPGTRDIPQPGVKPGGSSRSRYDTLARLAADLDREAAGAADLVARLASHEAVSAPYSPCRHPEGEITGRTLGTAVFDLGEGTFTLYEGNPCEARPRTVG